MTTVESIAFYSIHSTWLTELTASRMRILSLVQAGNIDPEHLTNLIHIISDALATFSTNDQRILSNELQMRYLAVSRRFSHELRQAFRSSNLDIVAVQQAVQCVLDAEQNLLDEHNLVAC